MPQQYPPPPTEVIVTRPPRLKERTDSEEAKRKEREARSIAIEKAYTIEKKMNHFGKITLPPPRALQG